MTSSGIHTMVKGKCAAHPKTGHEGPEGEQKYSFTLSLNLVSDWGGWSMPCSSCFMPRKETQYSLQRRMGGLQGWFGQVQKILPHWDSIPGPSSLLASHYTDYAILLTWPIVSHHVIS